MAKQKKMVIAIVSGHQPEGAGSGVLISAQAKAYVALGYEVHMFVAYHTTNFKRIPGVIYHLVPFTGEIEPIERIPGAFPTNVVMFTSHTRSTANFWEISYDTAKEYSEHFRKFYEKDFAEINPSIIHSQHCWLTTAITTDFDYPVICTIHGTDLMGYERSAKELQAINEKLANGENSEQLLEEKAKYEYYMDMAEKAARNSKEIWVISHQQESKFKELFPFASDKVRLVRNGCDTSVYYNEPTDAAEILEKLESNVTPDKKIPMDYDKLAIFVGKFAGFKRVDLVLDAAKIYEQQMAEKGVKVLTVIAGAGALDAELKAHQAEIGTKNVHFVGRVDATVVRGLNNIADVFLAPSDNEPDGLVYKECMLCGNVAVGTLGGGVPDTINPENIDLTSAVENSEVYPTPYGVLVPMGDAKSLANAAMFVFENPDKFDRTKIIEYAKENYDQMNISKNVIIPTFEKYAKED